MRFLDNVLTSFIETAPDTMARARYSALRERSVGLGVMGFHSFLQARGIRFVEVPDEDYRAIRRAILDLPAILADMRAQAETSTAAAADYGGRELEPPFR